jgi:rod shape determining protein RodA
VNAILRWLLDLFLRFVRTLDWSLCAALFALMAIALAVLYSAGGHNGMDLVVAQGARYGVGLAAMWGLSRVTPPRLRDATPLVYAATLLPLLLVLAIGTAKHGKHWIDQQLF